MKNGVSFYERFDVTGSMVNVPGGMDQLLGMKHQVLRFVDGQVQSLVDFFTWLWVDHVLRPIGFDDSHYPGTLVGRRHGDFARSLPVWSGRHGRGASPRSAFSQKAGQRNVNPRFMNPSLLLGLLGGLVGNQTAFGLCLWGQP